eukprot:scaffold2526_cov131-Cylindrotheca_fusiformis.AAC.2
MPSFQSNNMLVFGALAAVVSVGILLYELQTNETKTDEGETHQNDGGMSLETKNSHEQKSDGAKKDNEATVVSGEHGIVKKPSEDVFDRDLSFTEPAGENTNPENSEHRRQSRLEKEQYVQDQQLGTAIGIESEEKKADNEAHYQQVQTEPTEATLPAVDPPRVQTVMDDPAVAEESKQLSEQQGLVPPLRRGEPKPGPKKQSEENHEADSSSFHGNQNRRGNKSRNTEGAVGETGVENSGRTPPVDVAAILKAKTKGSKSSRKKNQKGSAAAAAVKEINKFQSSTKKKKHATKTRQ